MSPFAEFSSLVREQEPLAPHTWLRVGGAAQYYAEPKSVEELQQLVTRARQTETPLRLLGGGSNLLVRDEGAAGLVLRLSAPVFTQVQVDGKNITAGGGAKLGELVAASVQAGLAGLETLVGIPGTVGGALHGNAGGRGGDVGQWTCKATVMTKAGVVYERKREELVFSYRSSSLDELAILSAEFALRPVDPQDLLKRMQKTWIVTKANQPLSHQNCACLFKDPRGMSAAMLIQQAGLREFKQGGAEISDRHANFVVAQPGAKSADVLRLVDHVRQTILDRLGVELELELDVW